jgi:phosphatidylserine synthase
MCWNKDISLNTFLFSVFALLFIYITNTYTKYKTPSFDNKWVYVVTLMVSSMQLLEYFIWKNIKNRDMNIFLSKIGLFLIVLQICSFILLADKAYRYLILFVFVVFSMAVYFYKSLYNPLICKFSNIICFRDLSAHF